MLKENIRREKCPVCGSSDCIRYNKEVRENPRKTSGFWECQECKFVYQMDFPRYNQMTNLLNGVSEPFDINTKDRKIWRCRNEFEIQRPGFKRRRDKATKFVPAPAVVVEVGFGGGNVLCLLKEAGYEAIGIEIAERYVLHAHALGFAAYWADITRGTPEEVKGKADLVIGTEMMEHVESPVEFMKGAVHLLKPGGRVAFTFATPEQRSTLSYGEGQYWRPSAVIELFKRAGLDIEDIGVEKMLMFVWGKISK